MNRSPALRTFLAIGMAFMMAGCESPTGLIDDDDLDDLDELETTILLRDTFARIASSGWGWPDVGPHWFTGASNASDFHVADGRGIIAKSDEGTRNVIARTAKSADGYGLNVSGTASFRIETAPDDPAAFYTVQVYARRDDRELDGQNYYRFRVRAFGHGRMDVRAEKSVAYERTWLTDITTIPIAWETGALYWLRWEAIGTSPATRLRMRVWREGTSEPSAWALDLSHNEPHLDIIGTTGFRVSGPNAGQTTFPTILSFGDVKYEEID
jgi:hypothetical protein